MPTQLNNGELAVCRKQLEEAVKNRWPNDTTEDKLKRNIVCSCIKQGLVQGATKALLLNPVPICKLERAVSQVWLAHPLVDHLRGIRSSSWCQVIDKPDGPHLLPWLHDILAPTRGSCSKEIGRILQKMPVLKPPAARPGLSPQTEPVDDTDIIDAPYNIKEFKGVCVAPAASADFIKDRTHPGFVYTPPVDEARQMLLDALSDVWDDDDRVSVFAKTAATICLKNAFVIGVKAPYYMNVLGSANMSNHLHKHGRGMMWGTFLPLLKRADVRPYLQLINKPKEITPDILLLLSNVFNGHPSDLVNDVVKQTMTIGPASSDPQYYAATVMAPAFTARFPKVDSHGHSSEATSVTAITAAAVSDAAPGKGPAVSDVAPSSSPAVSDVASSKGPAVSDAASSKAPANGGAAPSKAPAVSGVARPKGPVPASQAETRSPEEEARIALQRAIATGPICGRQEAAAIVGRSITWACLANGFFANSTGVVGDALAGNKQHAYKLHSTVVAKIGEHARGTMDEYGFKGRDISELLESVEFRSHFKKFSFDGQACVRPVFCTLVPQPDPATIHILRQIKLLDWPRILPTEVPLPVSPAPKLHVASMGAPNPHGSLAGTDHTSVDTTAQPPREGQEQVGKNMKSLFLPQVLPQGPPQAVTQPNNNAHSTAVTAPTNISLHGAEQVLADTVAPVIKAGIQVLVVDILDLAAAAMKHIVTCSSITVCCAGWGGPTSGPTTVIQVMTMEVCFLFDLLVADSATNAAIKHAVRHVMESKTILKLTHGCGRLSAVLRYQLLSGLHSVCDTQVAYHYMEFNKAICDNLEDQPDLDITLEQLSECYGAHYDDEISMRQPTEAAWRKRPMAAYMQQYCMLLCQPVSNLADKMLADLGSFGKQCVMSMSKAAAQQGLKPTDKTPVNWDQRYKAKQVVDMFLPSFPTFEDLSDSSSSMPASNKLSGRAADKDDPDLSLIKAHGTKQAFPNTK